MILVHIIEDSILAATEQSVVDLLVRCICSQRPNSTMTGPAVAPANTLKEATHALRRLAKHNDIHVSDVDPNFESRCGDAHSSLFVFHCILNTLTFAPRQNADVQI